MRKAQSKTPAKSRGSRSLAQIAHWAKLTQAGQLSMARKICLNIPEANHIAPALEDAITKVRNRKP